MMVEPLSARVAMLGAGACSCGVKTPLIHFHEPTCLYRRISDAADEVEVLEDCETDLEARAEAAESSLAAANAEIERLREERAAVCKELGCVAKPGVALTFVKALRKEARRQYAQNVEIMRSWDAASPTELQELDRLRRGWGPSTPTERQARHADLLACVQAFSIALTDLALPEEIEVTEEAQKAFDAAYDRVYAGYITVLEVSQKMNEPIAKPDIDWEARAFAAESSVATLTARVAELEASLLPMADVGELIEQETSGFSDDDPVELMFDGYLLDCLVVADFRRARALFQKDKPNG